MSDAAVLVDTISVGTSQRLLKYSQVHIHTVALLLVAFLHVIRDAALAVLAAVGAKTAAAKLSAKHTILLLKPSSGALVPADSGPVSYRGAASCSPAVDILSQCHQVQALVATVAKVQFLEVEPGRCRAQQYLIPPQLPHHQGRLTVVLDLDETLLCTYRLQVDEDAVRLVPSCSAQSTSSSPRRMSLSSIFSSSSGGRRSSCSSSSSGGYHVSTCKPSDGQLAFLGAEYGAACWMTFTPVNSSSGIPATTLAVFERPGCRQFLLELSKFAECILFTAASSAYAQPLADLLDPDHSLFAARLFSNSCRSVGGREGVKDLSGFGRDLSRVVLVDNSPYSFMLQPSNGLPCMPFHGQSTDKQLLGVILPLLQSLSQLPDIRPLLSSKFHVREWLTSKGCQPPAADFY
eukprot:GHUV01004006.1.p1 GENE.GHUV01004006.1~~GHUV01004006.1.p1  ORF type:complete len:405 (+),score=88.36 GHUV01004006.1:185-1399(+)